MDIRKQRCRQFMRRVSGKIENRRVSGPLRIPDTDNRTRFCKHHILQGAGQVYSAGEKQGKRAMAVVLYGA
jgi:hypothetical protein